MRWKAIANAMAQALASAAASGAVLATAIALAATGALSTRAALAQQYGDGGSGLEGQEVYIDDRSTPQAVIESLYNAVSLHDYPRAWSYFDPATAPEYDGFAAGYADTDHVDVRSGDAVAEGAAGSTYWMVPVVIEATRTDGSVAVFAGCYVLRQSNPYLRDRPPYDPISIFKGRLRPSSAPFELAEGDCAGL